MTDSWRPLAYGYDPQNAPDGPDEPLFDPWFTTPVGEDETACCHATTTFHDGTLCCRSCYREVMQ